MVLNMAFTIGFTTTLLLHKIHKFMPYELSGCYILGFTLSVRNRDFAYSIYETVIAHANM